MAGATPNGHTNGFHLPHEEEHAKLEPAPKKQKVERTAFGLALYALSSCFLATMLMFAKKLGALDGHMPCMIICPACVVNCRCFSHT